MKNEIHFTERPCATNGYDSYRYKGRFGWIMIGAKDVNDALNEVKRSLCNPNEIDSNNLQIWNGKEYVNVK